MLLLGGMGTGKTAQAVSLLQELPEVRLIIVPEGETAHIPGLLQRLSGQPLKFILLLDDIAADGDGIRLISSVTAGFRAIPPNILIYATSREEGGPLPGRITFRYPALKEFTGMISEFLEAEGKIFGRAGHTQRGAGLSGGRPGKAHGYRGAYDSGRDGRVIQKLSKKWR